MRERDTERCSQAQNMIYHFSHVHVLEFISTSPLKNAHVETRCCGPTIDADPGTLFGCRPCSFFIHKGCSELPSFIRHPSHPSHSLSLVPISPYLQGAAECDACRKPMNSCFFYHCTHCNYDIHTYCAFLPTTIHHVSHCHPLSLNSSCAYIASLYDCDICRRSIGEKAWFYHCEACDFEAHVDCIPARPSGAAVGTAAPRPVDNIQSPPQVQPMNPLILLQTKHWPEPVGAPGGSSRPSLGNTVVPAHGPCNDGGLEGQSQPCHVEETDDAQGELQCSLENSCSDHASYGKNGEQEGNCTDEAGEAGDVESLRRLLLSMKALEASQALSTIRCGDLIG